jgi:glutamate-1-semialdehyde 2,1-aminomutase
MLSGGVYLAPSAFEAGFSSVVHGAAELIRWTNAAERALPRVQETVDIWARSR